MAASSSRLPDSLTLQLIGLGRMVQRRFEDELRRSGLSMRHLGALGHLSRDSELSYSDLARRARVTSQSMNATVKALEDLGAVLRSEQGHGRRARLEITAEGRRLLTVAADCASALDTELGHDLSDEEERLVRRIFAFVWAAEQASEDDRIP